MNRTVRRGCVSVVMAIIAGAGTICCAQDNAEAAAPPMYEYKPARIALSTDQMAFQRSLIQKLIASVNSQTTLSDIETLTGRHFIVQVLDEDFLDDHRRFSSYVYDYPEGYRIEFQVFKTIPGASVATDGFRLLLHVPDMRGIDVSECLSLADVSYFASRAGWDGLEPVHPSRIDLHGFAMERGGLRLEASARGNVVDRHPQSVGGSPAGPGLYDDDYIRQVYTFQGCLDDNGTPPLVIESNVGLAPNINQ